MASITFRNLDESIKLRLRTLPFDSAAARARNAPVARRNTPDLTGCGIDPINPRAAQ